MKDNFKPGVTRFLENQEGEYGEDRVLLEDDIDLSQKLGEDGYSVIPALTNEQFMKLKQYIMGFIKEGLIIALGAKKLLELEKKLGQFILRIITLQMKMIYMKSFSTH